jgi:hypothetical protein
VLLDVATDLISTAVFHLMESLPWAFFLDRTEAVMNIGAFKIVPGRARSVQIARRIERYIRRLRVFQLAFVARGTCMPYGEIMNA